MLVPWLLHGTYDFILMVGGASESDIGILGFIGVIILIIFGLIYARYEAIQLSLHGNADGSKKLDIHAAIVCADESTGEVITVCTKTANRNCILIYVYTITDA